MKRLVWLAVTASGVIGALIVLVGLFLAGFSPIWTKGAYAGAGLAIAVIPYVIAHAATQAGLLD